MNTYTRFLEYLIRASTSMGKSCLKEAEVLLLTSFYGLCSHGKYTYNIIINYELLNKRSYTQVTIVIHTYKKA